MRTCQTRAACKVSKDPKAELVLNNKKLEPRDSIAIDIASMPVSPRGKNGFCLIVDQATKFVSVAILLCRGLRPNRTCRIGRGRPLPTP